MILNKAIPTAIPATLVESGFVGPTCWFILINKQTNNEYGVQVTDISVHSDRYQLFHININVPIGQYIYKFVDENDYAIEYEVGMCQVYGVADSIYDV